MSTLPFGFTCWKAESVAATIPTEAATPSDEVLLATHSPLRIRREGARVAKRAEFVSEQEVVDEFLGSTPNAGVLIAPVLGESGAGKSHLVRWADANIPEAVGRHKIYLQKTQTSLRDVVTKLLNDKTGPVFDEIRRQVSGLGTTISVSEMERKILAELAEVLRSRDAQSFLDKPLVGEQGLGLLFLDPLFREHMLRPGSFINRRAMHALNGRDPDEPDVPLEFTVDELPLDITDVANLGDASKVAQNLFRKLVVNTDMQLEAVRILNESLDVAVMKAANLDVGNVNRAFMKLREELVGEEIVLLIEDVALIQGVRRDLLDAIHESSMVQGVEKYATVRTLLAVTPSYYRENLPETFRTRAEASSPSYVVDVQIDGGKTSESDLVDFVGRYLNAARVGKDALEAEMKSKKVAPNACDNCDFSDACHSTFGTSEAGHGLYPYNEAAVIRAVRSCVDPDNPGLFSPRRVLAGAIREVLMDAAGQLPNGSFPPGRLLGERARGAGLPPLSLSVRQRLEEDYPKDLAPRLESVLAFWGKAGTQPISEAVFHSFGLEPIAWDEVPDKSDDDSAHVDRSRQKQTDDLPKSLQRQLQAIEDWSSKDQVLPQDIARTVRSLLREAVLARLDWLAPVIKTPDTETLKRAVPADARSVSIEGAQEAIAKGFDPIVRIQRSARNAVLLQGLVLIEDGRAAQSGDALAQLDAVAAEAVPAARGRILDVLEYQDASMIDAARSLIIGALACGHLNSTARDIDLIRAVSWRGESDRDDSESRHAQWLDSYRAYVKARGEAVDRFLGGVGAAQGVGAVHALDSVRLVKIVKAARAQIDALPESVPTWCADANRKLSILIQVAVGQRSHWAGLVARARRLLPEAVSYVDTVDAVILAAREGQAQGRVKVKDLQGLVRTNELARDYEARCIVDVERILANTLDQDGVALARLIGQPAGRDLARIVEYLEDTERWIESGISDAEIDTGVKVDIDDAIESQVMRWIGIVEGGADGE